MPYIFSESKNTHTKDTSAVRKSKILPNLGFGDRWADFDRDAHSSEDQSRPIRGSASLDPDLIHLLCTCTVLPNDPM